VANHKAVDTFHALHLQTTKQQNGHSAEPDVLLAKVARRRSYVIPERLTKIQREEIARDIAELRSDEWAMRPKTRADCASVPRPCPFVGCRHHLAIEVTEVGNLKVNFPDIVNPPEVDLDKMEATCALDVADSGGVTLERCGELLNFTRERARQVEVQLLAKLLPFWKQLTGEDL
jgi:hypothetical protein